MLVRNKQTSDEFSPTARIYGTSCFPFVAKDVDHQTSVKVVPRLAFACIVGLQEALWDIPLPYIVAIRKLSHKSCSKDSRILAP